MVGLGTGMVMGRDGEILPEVKRVRRGLGVRCERRRSQRGLLGMWPEQLKEWSLPVALY